MVTMSEQMEDQKHSLGKLDNDKVCLRDVLVRLHTFFLVEICSGIVRFQIKNFHFSYPNSNVSFTLTGFRWPLHDVIHY